MADILIVDDEKILASSLKMLFSDEGHVASAVHSRAAVLEQLEKLSPDVILLDLRLPDGSGMEVLRTIRSVLPEALVIMMTAFGDTALVVEAIKLGAFDYIGKPFELQEILLLVEKALAQQKLRDEVTFLRSRQHGTELAEMVGNCEAMSEVCERIRLVAGAGDSAVLVTGESGTGKELVASALHKLSDRRRQAFVEVNCAAIPENLLESELFGFEKGAFTDAQSRKKGLFELAQDGTIFLDEIGEMPLHLQAKLLRFLEKHSFRRLGGTSDITINARIVAATNRDLRERVQQGAFREDLFYRLNVIPIHLPPCVSATMTSCCWPGIFSISSAAAWAARPSAFPPRWRRPSERTHGRATSGNSRTSSSDWSSFLPGRSSKSPCCLWKSREGRGWGPGQEEPRGRVSILSGICWASSLVWWSRRWRRREAAGR